MYLSISRTAGRPSLTLGRGRREVKKYFEVWYKNVGVDVILRGEFGFNIIFGQFCLEMDHLKNTFFYNMFLKILQ